MKILFLTPDENAPIGGIKQIYRQVDILQEAGLDAYVLHQTPGFRCTWFPNSTPVLCHAEPWWRPWARRVSKRAFAPFPITPGAPIGRQRFLEEDVVVVPEIFAMHIPTILPQKTRKVIFNQNHFQTFRDLGLNSTFDYLPYKDPSVLGTLVVSEESQNYLSYAFPKHPFVRIYPGIDEKIFHFGEGEREKTICYMPRKLPHLITHLLALLPYRAPNYRFLPMEGIEESVVAKSMQQASIFLSTSHEEGLGLPPLEAMATGCLVVGFDGIGGREYFRPPFARPVPTYDMLAYLKAAEETISLAESPEANRIRQDASNFVLENYSMQNEKESLLEAWSALWEKASCHSQDAEATQDCAPV